MASVKNGEVWWLCLDILRTGKLLEDPTGLAVTPCWYQANPLSVLKSIRCYFPSTRLCPASSQAHKEGHNGPPTPQLGHRTVLLRGHV